MRKMKKVFLSLIVAVLIAWPVYAEEETSAGGTLVIQTAGDGTQQEVQRNGAQQGETQQDETTMPDTKETETDSPQAPAVRLSIDNENVYEGMASAYDHGYTPTVADDQATVILPLMADGRLKEDRLTAEVDLGSTERSSFVYKNYEKSFKLTDEPVNGTSEKKSVFYIRFDLSLAKDRYNGVYPVTIHVTGKDEWNQEIDQNFTAYVTIQDGADPNAVDEPIAEPEETPASPTSAPVVLVTGCEISPNKVEAGSAFTAVVTLKNTSTIKYVQNMVITVTEPGADFTLLDDSNTIYLEKLGSDETTELTLDFATSPNTAEGKYKIELAMSYDDPDAVTLSSAGSFDVNIIQTPDVQLTVPSLAGTVTAGDTIPLDFQVMNLGRSGVYNVRCDVSGDGLLPVNTAFIGNMEAGSEGTASLQLFIGAKTMSEGYTGTDPYGETTGTITLSYEDGAGEVYSQAFIFETTIEAPAAAVVYHDEEEERPSGQWWLAVLILGGMAVLTGTGVGAYFLGKKQR